MDDELLDCAIDDLMCPPPDAAPVACPPPSIAGGPSPETTAMDDATSDIVGPPLLDVGPEPARPPLLDLPPTARPAPRPAPTVQPPAPAPADELPLLLDEPDRTRREQDPWDEPVRFPTEVERARQAELEREQNQMDHFGVGHLREQRGHGREIENGPYVYGGLSQDENYDLEGVTFGAGLGHHSGIDSDADAGIHFGAGTWTDLEGEQWHGIRVNGGLTGGVHDDFGAAGRGEMEGSALSGDLGVYWNDETFTIGGQANLGEAAATLGTNPDATSPNDTSVRFGGSAGEGAALRLHYGDEDGDTRPEYGFGFDAGPISFDGRSEIVGEMWNAARDWWNEDDE